MKSFQAKINVLSLIVISSLLHDGISQRVESSLRRNLRELNNADDMYVDDDRHLDDAYNRYDFNYGVDDKNVADDKVDDGNYVAEDDNQDDNQGDDQAAAAADDAYYNAGADDKGNDDQAVDAYYSYRNETISEQYYDYYGKEEVWEMFSMNPLLFFTGAVMFAISLLFCVTMISFKCFNNKDNFIFKRGDNDDDTLFGYSCTTDNTELANLDYDQCVDVSTTGSVVTKNNSIGSKISMKRSMSPVKDEEGKEMTLISKSQDSHIMSAEYDPNDNSILAKPMIDNNDESQNDRKSPSRKSNSYDQSTHSILARSIMDDEVSKSSMCSSLTTDHTTNVAVANAPPKSTSKALSFMKRGIKPVNFFKRKMNKFDGGNKGEIV